MVVADSDTSLRDTAGKEQFNITVIVIIIVAGVVAVVAIIVAGIVVVVLRLAGMILRLTSVITYNSRAQPKFILPYCFAPTQYNVYAIASK